MIVHRPGGPIRVDDMKRLWCAVLLQAWRDATSNEWADRKDMDQHRRDARLWFREAGQDFRETCINAGFDPARVQQWYKDQNIEV